MVFGYPDRHKYNAQYLADNAVHKSLVHAHVQTEMEMKDVEMHKVLANFMTIKL